MRLKRSAGHGKVKWEQGKRKFLMLFHRFKAPSQLPTLVHRMHFIVMKTKLQVKLHFFKYLNKRQRNIFHNFHNHGLSFLKLL